MEGLTIYYNENNNPWHTPEGIETMVCFTVRPVHAKVCMQKRVRVAICDENVHSHESFNIGKIFYIYYYGNELTVSVWGFVSSRVCAELSPGEHLQ